MRSPDFSNPSPASPAQSLRRSTRNLLVIWSIWCASPSDHSVPSLYAAALRKADRGLHDAYLAIVAPDLRTDPELPDQYTAVGNFMMTWNTLGPLVLQDWRAYLPLLDQASSKLQTAFVLPTPPSHLI